MEELRSRHGKIEDHAKPNNDDRAEYPDDAS